VHDDTLTYPSDVQAIYDNIAAVDTGTANRGCWHPPNATIDVYRLWRERNAHAQGTAS
jgi:hypothetical protein